MFGQDLLGGCRCQVGQFELDSYEERGFGDMNHGIALLCTRNPLGEGPCEQLTAPLWPADESSAGRLPLALPPIGTGQRNQGQYEDDKHLSRPVAFLRRRLQVSLLLTRYQAGVLGQTAVIIVVEEPRGLVDRDLGSVQEGGAPLHQGPLIHPVHPSHLLFAVQVSRHSGIDATGDRPTQPLCQALGELILCLSPWSTSLLCMHPSSRGRWPAVQDLRLLLDSQRQLSPEEPAATERITRKPSALSSCREILY